MRFWITIFLTIICFSGLAQEFRFRQSLHDRALFFAKNNSISECGENYLSQMPILKIDTVNGKVRLLAVNCTPIEHTINTRIKDKKNRKSSRGLKLIKPFQELILLDGVEYDETKDIILKEFDLYLGNKVDNIDLKYVYGLPFNDAKPKAIFSREPKRILYRFDIPNGTSVQFIRSGIVISWFTESLKNNKQKNCLEELSNLEVLHEDGSIAKYTIGSKNEIIPKLYERVEKGQRILWHEESCPDSFSFLEIELSKANLDKKRKCYPIRFKEHLP